MNEERRKKELSEWKAKEIKEKVERIDKRKKLINAWKKE